LATSMTAYPPGPTNWRQSLIQIQYSPTEFLLDLQRTYGNFVHYRHGPAHCYLINDPELIRKVLVDDSPLMSRPPVSGRSIGKFLGHGLLNSSGEYHHAQRKAIQPIFTPTWITSYAQTMQDCVAELTSMWRHGEIRDLTQDMTDLTMNIIYRTVFGTSADHLRHEVRAAIGTLQRYSGEMLRRTPQVSDAECQTAIQQLDAAIHEMISRHSGEGAGHDLLSRLLTAETAGSSAMTAQQIRDEAVTLFVAGQETSANALAWLFYLLAHHPDVEAKLRKVLDPEQPASNFAEWTILETLRLYPPAWLIGRTPNEPYDIQGFTIQPGDSLVICPYVLHRTPELFAHSDQFLPERFQVAPPKYGYLPFGAGPHVCIGQAFAMQEIMISLKAVIGNWHFELVDTDPIEPEPLITLQSKTPIRVRLQKPW